MKGQPTRLFLLRLSLALGIPKKRLCEELDVSDVREYMAFDRYIEPIGRQWEQTGVLAALTIAPHTKGKTPNPKDFIPIRKPPMTAEEIAAELSKLKVPGG